MFNCIADFEDGNMRDIEQNREHYVRLVRESEDASITGSWGSNQDFRYRMLADKNIFLGGGVEAYHIGNWMWHRRFFEIFGTRKYGAGR